MVPSPSRGYAVEPVADPVQGRRQDCAPTSIECRTEGVGRAGAGSFNVFFLRFAVGAELHLEDPAPARPLQHNREPDQRLALGATSSFGASFFLSSACK